MPTPTLLPPPWHARLALTYRRDDAGTRLVHNRHEGPLRVQRVLYPPTTGGCETLVLHPPGGIAGGDRLDIEIEVGEGASVLLSTPGAAKWYRSAGRTAHQDTRLTVRDDACLEWLPQESILFTGADAGQRLLLELSPRATCLGWDIVQLGRTAAGDAWDQGHLRQWLEIRRATHPLWIDCADFAANDPVRQAITGLAGMPVFGTLWCASPRLSTAPEAALDAIRAVLEAKAPFPDADRLRARPASVQARLCAAASHLPAPTALLLVRAIGDDAESLRGLLEAVWHVLRPIALDKPAYRPRIWAT